MRDLRRISAFSILLIVVVRLSIGWQLLYEGLWKLDTQNGPNPWTAAGYLKNAQGPFRDLFRNMTGDPDDLNWLDYDQVSAKWDRWKDRFVQRYGASESQQRALDEMLNGKSEFVAELKQLPDGVVFDGSLGRIISYDAEKQRLKVDGTLHLLPRERERLLEMAPLVDKPEGELTDEEKARNAIAKAYHSAVRRLDELSSRLSFKERLAVSLKGDPKRAGVVVEKYKGTIDYSTPGEIQLYRDMLRRYEEKLAVADQDFEFEHLQKQWGEIQQKRAQLVGPIRALEGEWTDRAYKILSPEQTALGGLAPEWSQMRKIDLMTMWALTILGGLLIVGLFTPFASIASAGLILSFYLVMPPWPGVPEAPGPEHSVLINKNLIEVFALFMIASLPTGRWFGLDSLAIRQVGRRKGKKPKSASQRPAQSPAIATPVSPAEPTDANENEESTFAGGTYSLKKGTP